MSKRADREELHAEIRRLILEFETALEAFWRNHGEGCDPEEHPELFAFYLKAASFDGKVVVQ